MERKTLSVTVGNETLTFETGKIAKQAHGAVLIRAGESMVFTTVCRTAEPLANVDFLPLRVDHQEKFFSAGKTVSGFIKREGKPTEREILVSRLIDRPIRPMFEDGYYHEVQILSYVWSYDGVNSTEPLAICGASAALCLSDIPFIKPVGAVRVGYIDGQFVVNPTVTQQKNSKLDLILAGTEDAVLMIEGYCDFLTEEQILEAIELGHQGIRQICQALSNWQKEIGKPKYRDSIKPLSQEILAAVEKLVEGELSRAIRIRLKKEREEALKALHKMVKEQLTAETAEIQYDPIDVQRAWDHVSSSSMRKMILQEGVRADGRSTKDIRFIDVEQGLLPRAHGSSLFTRGETQTVAVCTLGGENMGQRFEDLEGEGLRRFYLQYFFPSFSVGEVGRVGSPGRREIGHGKLAERALQIVLPPKEAFPYTIRLESNITESNGSSSMASVCGGCLALMDAGVPITRPVSGIAMGLILEKDQFVILSDILGIEDALGDMDFKITGDQHGITAFQMDIKVEGITIDIMKAALLQAKEGRIHILKKMLEFCPQSKTQMSVYAPRIETLQIKPSKIGVVVGPGGKQIRSIIEQTGVQIDISDEGIVSISANSLDAIEKAKSIILGLVAEVEVGKMYSGKITSIVPFGVFVEVLPNKEGLCHISELDTTRIENIQEFAIDGAKIKVGDPITVVVLEINDRGQLKLSRKALLKGARALK